MGEKMSKRQARLLAKKYIIAEIRQDIDMPEWPFSNGMDEDDWEAMGEFQDELMRIADRIERMIEGKN